MEKVAPAVDIVIAVSLLLRIGVLCGLEVLFEAREPPLPELSIGVIQALIARSGSGRSRYIRRWRSTRTSTTPASRSTRRCLETGGLAHRRHLDQLAHGPLAVAQQIEDAATVRFRQQLEGSDHPNSMPIGLYACQRMNWLVAWAVEGNRGL